MRFTLPKLFLAVMLVALACAGMTLRTRWWAESIVSLTVLMFVAVAISAAIQGGRFRAVGLTFSAVGAGYILLSTCSILYPLRSCLLTDRSLILAANSLQVPVQPLPPGPVYGQPTALTSYIAPSVVNAPPTVLTTAAPALTKSVPATYYPAQVLKPVGSDPYEQLFSNRLYTDIPAVAFLVIGHSIWSVLLALLAGCFAGWTFDKREKQRKS